MRSSQNSCAISMANRDTVEEYWGLAELVTLSPVTDGDSEQYFLSRFSSLIDLKGRAFWFNSGCDALSAALRALPSIPKKNKVLIASFNCEVVAAAVISSGYQVKTFDLEDRFGGISWEKIAEQDIADDVRAIVIPHLFGVPSDFRGLVQVAKDKGIYLIEDCAHTLGGKISEESVGNLGDCAIYSFNYDKPISLGGGGVLVVNNNEVLINPCAPCIHESLAQEMHMLTEFLEMMYRRRDNITCPPAGLLKRVLNKLAGTRKPVKFSGLGALRAALGIYQIDRYAEIAATRNKNAQIFMNVAHWSSWPVGDGVTPVWLKQKLMPIKPMDTRSVALKLQREGLRVGSFNWGRTIDTYLGRQAKPNSAYIARFGLDVPVHQNMNEDELKFIVDTLTVL